MKNALVRDRWLHYDNNCFLNNLKGYYVKNNKNSSFNILLVMEVLCRKGNEKVFKSVFV